MPRARVGVTNARTVRTLSLVLVCLALAGACASSRSNEPAPTPTPATSSGAEGVDAAAQTLTNEPPAVDAAVAAAPAAPTLGPIAIVAGERRAVPTPSPRVAIRAPANNSTVRENRVEVRLDVLHWRDVANASDMRHIHLVLDNEAYRRVDDPSRPVVLENLSEGTHVLRAFPGWETHETVKEAGAFAVAVFHVGRATPTLGFNPRAPLLTYSRPKGEVNGAAAERVLLDFYLTNIAPNELGDSAIRVRPTVDGTALPDLAAWVPYYITNLPDGPHTIGLQLIGRDGNPLAGPFNRAEQRITVSRAPAPAAASPHAGH